MEKKDRPCQIITCLCGSVYAACCVPECYQDDDWFNELKQASSSGHKIEMKDASEFTFTKCTCTIQKTTGI
jgi:hypothetical protein